MCHEPWVDSFTSFGPIQRKWTHDIIVAQQTVRARRNTPSSLVKARGVAEHESGINGRVQLDMAADKHKELQTLTRTTFQTFIVIIMTITGNVGPGVCNVVSHFGEA